MVRKPGLAYKLTVQAMPYTCGREIQTESVTPTENSRFGLLTRSVSQFVYDKRRLILTRQIKADERTDCRTAGYAEDSDT